MAALDAGIIDSADVHFVQIKCPLLTAEAISEATMNRALAADAVNLLWRLDEILFKQRGQYLSENAPPTPFNQYKLISTCYRIAAILGWIRAIRLEQSYLFYGDEAAVDLHIGVGRVEEKQRSEHEGDQSPDTDDPVPLSVHWLFCTVVAAPDDDYAALASLGDDLRFVLITSAARIERADAFAVAVNPSAAPKCERCWHWREDVGDDARHPQLCGRCVANLFGVGEPRRFA